MNNKKLIRISQIILAIIIAIQAIGALLHMVNPYFIDAIFENYIGQPWNDFVNQQPRQASLYLRLIDMAHCWYLMGMIYALYILFTSYGRGEKLSWIILLIGMVIASATPLVFGKIFTDPVGILIGSIGLVISLLGLLVGAIPVWKNKP